MDIKIAVPAKYIAVLKLFAAKKDVRYYLNGIAFEIGNAESRLFASDGHRVGIFRVESAQPDVAEPLINIIVPNELLAAIKADGLVEFTFGEPIDRTNARPVSVAYGGMTMAGKTMDGVLPDIRRVIPSSVTGEAAQFNPSYVADLAKAWAILHGKTKNTVTIGHNGQDAALIGLGEENFAGVIMPLRGIAPDAPPSWVSDRTLCATAEDLV